MEKPVGTIKEVARLFLKLGFTSFGGPAVHISMMRTEVVEKLKWFDDYQFLDMLGAAHLVPGPTSTEMSILISKRRAGWKGMIIGGLCFIMPAVIITGIIAWLYSIYGTSPELQSYVYGIQPAIIVVILSAIYPLAKKSVRSIPMFLLGITSLALCLLGFNQLYIMFGVGFIALGFDMIKNRNITPGFLPFTLLQSPLTSLVSITNSRLFFAFLKVGVIIYGSGYVLFSFLDSEFVQTGFLKRQQLIDAIVVGQFTPGPVFSTVTFVGYQLNGLSGAVLGTIAIFLPAFVFIGVLGTTLLKLRHSKSFSSFLDAVNVASIAIIMAVCYDLGKDSITNWRTITIAIVCGIIAFIFQKLNHAWIILCGAVLGYLFTFV
ncbi:MAG TPA: chromate efflux transporter [Bacteroidia bacterium]|nr:chromate efflux transporter [Bacteroidia bacterium]